MHKVEFFKGDRELSWWYIPVVWFWCEIFPIAEITRMALLLPDPVGTLVRVEPQIILLGMFFYFAWRNLSKWFVLVLMPLYGLWEEFVWHGFSLGNIEVITAMVYWPLAFTPRTS